MRRLFSNFADGWPGVGLLLLRVLTGAAIITFGTGSVRQVTPSASSLVSTICLISGIFLLIGLFTPLTGTVAAIVKMGLAVSQFASHSGDPWMSLSQVILTAALAMIGPGAWSIDACLFGRKHIELADP